MPGFANLVYDIGKVLSGDGKLFQVQFTKLGDSPLKGYASTDNQKTAVDSLWAVTSAPQDISPAMMEFLNAVGNAQAAGDTGTIQSALSSYAGSGITALHSAQKGALKDQVLHLRNRITHMGASLQYVNDDLPRFNTWIEGEGGYRKLDDRMDESGYKLNTWGGTFGFDVTCSDSFGVGRGLLRQLRGSGRLQGQRKPGLLLRQPVLAPPIRPLGPQPHSHLRMEWTPPSTGTAGVAGTDMYSMHGSTSGSSWGAFYEGTYDLYLNENRTSVFQPLVNGSIYKSRMDGFTETGGLGMSVEDMDSTYGTVGLGRQAPRGTLGKSDGKSLYGRTAGAGCPEPGRPENHRRAGARRRAGSRLPCERGQGRLHRRADRSRPHHSGGLHRLALCGCQRRLAQPCQQPQRKHRLQTDLLI